MPALPSFIGRYRILKLLGHGGMGTVYLGRDPAINRPVVIKATRVNDDAFRKRFLREARATGGLNHKSIVTIFDAGEHDGEPFIVMEYVEGRTVGEIIKRGERLPMPRRLQLMRELCDGLAYAHAKGIIHRDIKPDNLMVRDANGALAILDFGIARMAEAETASDADEAQLTSGMIGTPNYMAPEQIRGREVDCRCDIFSVGLVFYELLSYRRAFTGDTITGVIYKILHEDPPPLAGLDAQLDPAVVALVERAIARAPGDRYQDLGELIDDLDGVIARTAEESVESTVLLPSMREIEGATAPEESGAETVQRGEARGAALAEPLDGPGRREPGAGPPTVFARRLRLALGAALLVAGGLWLAGSFSDRPVAAPASEGASAASSPPPAEPGAGDDAIEEVDGVEARDAEEPPGADPRTVDELLAAANDAFENGRYGTARRLFREAYARGGSDEETPPSPRDAGPTTLDGPARR